jgi:DNA-binding MarR family transcriptional regulator
MITIHLTPDDLVAMRFAYRPMLEIPLSYRVLRNPALHGPHYRWVEIARGALHDVDLPYLDALVTADGCYIPNFLTPTPTGKRIELEDDLADLLATPHDEIRRDMRQMIHVNGDSEMRRFFLAHPGEALDCLIDDMRLYWQRTMAAHWSGMMGIIESDVLYRARTLALDGPGTLFEDLHASVGYRECEGRQCACVHPDSEVSLFEDLTSSVSYRDHVIEIRRTCQCAHDDLDISLMGTGLQLAPTVFASKCLYQIVPESPAMLAYQVRGTGVWMQSERAANRSLEIALGASRAHVLEALTTPQSTGELAFNLHVTAGTVSQHLSRLCEAGLIAPRRSGKRVYYHLTERGETLIALFERSP